VVIVSMLCFPKIVTRYQFDRSVSQYGITAGDLPYNGKFNKVTRFLEKHGIFIVCHE
jgi:hypothetical protein